MFSGHGNQSDVVESFILKQLPAQKLVTGGRSPSEVFLYFIRHVLSTERMHSKKALSDRNTMQPIHGILNFPVATLKQEKIGKIIFKCFS